MTAWKSIPTKASLQGSRKSERGSENKKGKTLIKDQSYTVAKRTEDKSFRASTRFINKDNTSDFCVNYSHEEWREKPDGRKLKKIEEVEEETG
jgi:hypothetical protein